MPVPNSAGYTILLLLPFCNIYTQANHQRVRTYGTFVAKIQTLHILWKIFTP